MNPQNNWLLELDSRLKSGRKIKRVVTNSNSCSFVMNSDEGFFDKTDAIRFTRGLTIITTTNI